MSELASVADYRFYKTDHISPVDMDESGLSSTVSPLREGEVEGKEPEGL